MIGAAFGLGFILGPAIGGWLGHYDLRLPFWAAAALSLANALYGFFILPESLPAEKRTPKIAWRSANVFGALRLLGSERELSLIAAAAFLSYLAHESLPSLFVLYADYRYHWDAQKTGWALAIVGVSQTIVSGGLVRPAVARLGERATLTIALLFGASGFLLYAFATDDALFSRPRRSLRCGGWRIRAPGSCDQATRRIRAGAAARGAREPARRLRHDRAAAVHADILDERDGEGFSRRRLSALGGAARREPFRRARRRPSEGSAAGLRVSRRMPVASPRRGQLRP